MIEQPRFGQLVPGLLQQRGRRFTADDDNARSSSDDLRRPFGDGKIIIEQREERERERDMAVGRFVRWLVGSSRRRIIEQRPRRLVCTTRTRRKCTTCNTQPLCLSVASAAGLIRRKYV